MAARGPSITTTGMESRGPSITTPGMAARGPSITTTGMEARGPSITTPGMAARGPSITTTGMAARGPSITREERGAGVTFLTTAPGGKKITWPEEEEEEVEDIRGKMARLSREQEKHTEQLTVQEKENKNQEVERKDFQVERKDLGMERPVLEVDNNEMKVERKDQDVCGKCSKGVEEEGLEVGGGVFHPACFTCDHCHTPLRGQFFRVDGLQYCPAHRDLTLSPCTLCGHLIRESAVQVSEALYHQECFVCSQCKEPIIGNFHTLACGSWVCEVDYRDSRPRCHTCTLPILDRLLTSGEKQYHPDCFRCHMCDSGLDGETFMADGDKVSCSRCFEEHRAQRCHRCCLPIVAKPGRQTTLVTCKERSYHGACYTCRVCDKDLGGKKAYLDPTDEVMCGQCGGGEDRRI